MVLTAALALAAAYLVGALPIGFLIARAFGLADIRRHGSGNIGATNVLRTLGKGPAILTLVGDIVKGAVAVAVAAAISGHPHIAATAAVLAVAGNCWSVFLGLPVATWGLGFYAGILALSIIGVQERFEDSRQLSVVMLGMTAVGFVFTGWLNYLEAFVIHAWCEWCIASAVLVLLLFLLAVSDFRRVSGPLLSTD